MILSQISRTLTIIFFQILLMIQLHNVHQSPQKKNKKILFHLIAPIKMDFCLY